MYNFSPGAGDFCRCTVNDGWICAKCRSKQCNDVELERQSCVGDGCDESLEWDKENRGICLWCDLPIAGLLPRPDLWQGYDQRYVISPHIIPYSTYAHAPGVDQVPPPEPPEPSPPPDPVLTITPAEIINHA